MVEMPMGADEMPDGVGAQACKSPGNPWARDGDAGIDEQLAVRSGQDGNIAAGAFEDADITAQPMDCNGRRGCRRADRADDVLSYGENLSGREPATRGGERRRTDTAQAEATARQQGVMGD